MRDAWFVTSRRFDDRAWIQALRKTCWRRALPLAVALVTGCGSATRSDAPDAAAANPVENDATTQTDVVDSPAPGVPGTAERRAEAARAGDVGPIQAGSTLGVLKKLTHVEPVYPSDAATAGVEGTVIVEAKIDAEGRVESARVVRSIPPLDQAALDAVMRWRFEPLMFEGEPTALYTTLTVKFTLPRTLQQRRK